MALETNIHALWGRKQTAKGTPGAAPGTSATGKRLRLAAQGAIATNVEMGSEPFNDLDQFGDAQDYITSIIGQGAPPVQATPDELAWLCWLFNGSETVSAIVGPPATNEHVGTPATNLFYSTFWRRTGASIIERIKNNDCVMSQMEIVCGTGQQVMRITPTIISLDPGEKFATDPSLGMPADKGFLWTEAEGNVNVNGSVLAGATQYTLTLNKNLEVLQAVSAKPYDLQPGTPTIGITMAMILDQAGFDLANFLLYGTTSPAAGAKPTVNLGTLGSFSVVHDQLSDAGVITGSKAKFEIAGVRWERPGAVAVPNPGGGGGTLELSGQMRKVAGSPAWKSTIRSPQVAFTA